ncbi:MAG: glycosyltransferase [bacterium]
MTDAGNTSSGDNPTAAAIESARRLVGGGSLSIVMPAYNLGPKIADNVRTVQSVFKNRVPFEIIVVDDGSTDGSGEELRKVAAEVPELISVSLPKNAGKGIAVMRGFEASHGSHVLFLDADLDLPPAQAFHFFEIMESERVEVVIGSKLLSGSTIRSYPWHRRLTTAAYYAMVKILVGLPVHDTQTGMKLFKREVLQWTVPRMLVKQFAFDLELLAIAHSKGFRIAEAPVTIRFQGTWGCFSPAMVRKTAKDTLAVFYRLHLLKYYQSIPDTSVPEPPPLVSIVIALPAPSGYLDECLAAVQRQTWQKYEVILLPDEPSGRAWPEKIREHPTGKCRPAEKRNMGLAAAKGDIIAFIDDDVVPVEDWIRRAIVHFSAAGTAAVGGPAATPNNDPYMARLSGEVFANRLVSGQHRRRYVPVRVCEVDDFPSCNLFVRKDAITALGGFRTDFWPGEDTYLCLEIVKTLRKKIIYDPRVEVLHHRRKLFLPHLRQIGRYALHRGYFARHFPETSRKVSYALPSLFVLGLLFGGMAAAVCQLCTYLYVGVVAFYAALTFLSCARRNPAAWVLVWLGVMSTHLWYGVRFMAGLLVKRLPSDVRKFDHPSEANNRAN